MAEPSLPLPGALGSRDGEEARFILRRVSMMLASENRDQERPSHHGV